MEWKRNFHTHTCYCDGKNTPDEMVEEAVKKQFSAIGFSGHAYTSFDTSYCMDDEAFGKYLEDLTRLQEEYRGRIQILKGLEYDYYAEQSCDELDYIIGSVHYVEVNGTYYPVDEGPECTERIIAACNGDPMEYAELYFNTVADVVRKTDCDVIGHFDLIKKFNRNGVTLVDEHHPRYVAAWKKAVAQLIPYGKPFEINTTPISWREDGAMYPSLEILKEIHRLGGKITISSDAHDRKYLDRGFAEAVQLAKAAEFEAVTALDGNPQEIPL